MAIVTLTSDLGSKDFYVASVKGSILSEIPDCTIVDISHDVSAFNIFEAAFILKNAYSSFPMGTIHIIGVDSEKKLGTKRGDILHVAVEYDGHYFIGTDNGIFDLMFGQVLCEQVELSFIADLASGTFPMRDIFAKSACHIIRGGTLQVLGVNKTGFYESKGFQPQVDEHGINGTVLYVDSFGNLITNITKAFFNQVLNGRDFDCKIRGNSYGIDKICEQYNDVENGTALAIFTSEGYLQIAINHGATGAGGGAAELFGLKMMSPVRIDFEKEVSNISDL